MLLASLAALAWVQTAPANTEQPQPEAGDTAETVIAPPPTDAATLIAGIESRYDAYGELSAELAARRTRERYLAGLLLPAIGRTDLDEGARGAILQTIGAQLSALETDNTQWAVRQLDPARFATLHAEEPRLAQDLLRWAERDPGSEAAIVAALEPVALNGGYDAQAFAERADRLALSRGQPQIYGSQTLCVEGREQLAPLDPARTAGQRERLRLPPLDVDAFLGEACEDTGAEGGSE